MKRFFLPLILLLAVSTAFSEDNPLVEFFQGNISLVVGSIVFIIVFGVSIGAANIWVDKSEQAIIIALGISLLVSVLIMLNQGLLGIVYSIITYSPLFLAAFILVALLLTVFLAKNNKPLRAIAAALLAASIFILIYINGGITFDPQSPSQSSDFNLGWLWLIPD